MSASSAPERFVHRQRRGAELVLLVISLAVGIGAYAAVGAGVDGTVPADLYGYGGWLVVLILAAHVAIRLRAPYADPVILPIISALNGIGLAEIHRINLAQPQTAPPAGSQLTWMTIGVVLFIAVLFGLRDHRRLQTLTYTSGLVAVLLLLTPLLPGIGTSVYGARIWIRLAGMSFQPGEAAKVLLVIAFAGYLVMHRDALALAGRRLLFIDLPRGRDLGPILAMWLVSLGILVFQNDIGQSLLFFGIFVVMLFIATERPGWLVVGAVMAIVGGTAAYFAVAHVRVRVDIWLDPFHAAQTTGYQLVQALFGMAWGGLTGRGLGQGDPQITPFGYSDFISSSLGEELGLTGLLAILLLYILLVERGLRTALLSRDDFGKLMATGLAVTFALQVFVVVGGVTGLIPLTGLTTPFLSYGGSSLIANWVIAALLLRISDQARKPPPEWSDRPEDADHTQVVSMR